MIDKASFGVVFCNTMQLSKCFFVASPHSLTTIASRTCVQMIRIMELNSDNENDDVVTHPASQSSSQRKRTTIPKQRRAIIVVDLDETLINNKYELFPGVGKFLTQLKTEGHVILWTAGNDVHVKKFLEKLDKNTNIFYGTICNLYNNTKSIAMIKKNFPELMCADGRVPIILLDDNSHNLYTGGYDLTIDVSRYYKNKNETRYNVDYTTILQKIHLLLVKWWSFMKKKQGKKTKQIMKMVDIASDYDDDDD
nr:hypothetical protein [Microctonus hyperodae filamentous virus]